MASEINTAIFKLIKRAEKQAKEHLINTFVDVGPLFTLLQNPDHQILYGRRGTGKTHALNYLQNNLENIGYVPIYIDMRNIGSNGGIYSDISLFLTERATRLLIDTFSVIHDQILNFVLSHDESCDLSVFGPLLDNLASSINEIEVVGDIEIEGTIDQHKKNTTQFGINASSAAFSILTKDEEEKSQGISQRKKIQGIARHRVHFTTINSIFSNIKNEFKDKEIWILIDEWAEVPLDLQPYLADLLRRSLFSIRGVTIKIAAIEKRTNFKINTSNSFIGLETGADISGSLNLDEFMVFDNNREKAIDFFKSLIYKHVNQFLAEINQAIASKEHFIGQAFTQGNAFEELVRASEGNPRDAINILVHSAIKSGDDKISIPHIRSAARSWYSTDKEKAITSKPEAKFLLRWIIDEIIGSRKAKAFLLSSEVDDQIIEYLFDNRIIHVIKQNISSNDRPGERFNAYAIDYGAYVHLINTTNEPQGLLEVETENGDEFTEVPVNDYRSIRRAILNIDEYYRQSTSQPQ